MFLRTIRPLTAAIVIGPLVFASGPANAQYQNQWMNDAFGDTSTASRSVQRTAPKRADTIDRTSRGEPLISQAAVAGLDRAISSYSRLVQSGGWQAIPGKQSLRPGGDDRRFAALRQRLKISGELNPKSRGYGGYDEELSAAVRAYQQRIGLTPTGIANNRTLEMLNVSAEQRLRQLQLNRARLAELLGKAQHPRYIQVNVPGYELQAVEQGRVALFSRVVVGKPSTPTPELSASVRAINLLPYWHVPQTIARRALIPKLKEDPHYLAREHIRTFASWGGEEVNPSTVNWWSPQGERFVFRQDPGTFNALGVVRIDMPNKHIVYMHDTPLKQLFNYAMRPYSAGCVRVQNVLELAAWLVAPDTGLNRGSLETMIGQFQRETIKLAQPVPVIFSYLTAWVTADGTVHFRSDIYDKDQAGSQVAASGAWDKAEVRVTP